MSQKNRNRSGLRGTTCQVEKTRIMLPPGDDYKFAVQTAGFIVGTISVTGKVMAFYAQIIGNVIPNALERLINRLAKSLFHRN